jgi:hypothetical protein
MLRIKAKEKKNTEKYKLNFEILFPMTAFI